MGPLQSIMYKFDRDSTWMNDYIQYIRLWLIMHTITPLELRYEWLITSIMLMRKQLIIDLVLLIDYSLSTIRICGDGHKSLINHLYDCSQNATGTISNVTIDYHQKDGYQESEVIVNVRSNAAWSSLVDKATANNFDIFKHLQPPCV